MEALQQPTIRVVAVIAEGVPEADTKKLIAYARAHNKILLGPATVGGLQVGTYRFIEFNQMLGLLWSFFTCGLPFSTLHSTCDFECERELKLWFALSLFAPLA
jgi:hypothetical protein